MSYDCRVRARVLVPLILAACHDVAAPPVVVALPEAQIGPAIAAPSMPEETAPARLATNPFATGQQWVGTYRCAQGETDLVLRVVRVDGPRVDAVFEFEHVDSGAVGSYEVHGMLEGTGQISLSPGAWRSHPAGYESVGMTGHVDGEHFGGRIDHASCGEFSVTLDSAIDEEDED